MATRTTYRASALSTVTFATVTATDILTLTYTPSANSEVLHIWSMSIGTSAADVLTVRTRADTDATVLSEVNLRTAELTPFNRYPVSGIHIYEYGAAPGAKTISLEAHASATDANITYANARLWAIELGANDYFVNGQNVYTPVCGGAWVTVSGSELVMSAATSGPYLLLGYAEGTTTGIQGTLLRMTIDGSAIPGESILVNTAIASTDTFWNVGTRQTFAAGSHTIRLQGQAVIVVGGIRRGRIAALELASFTSDYINESANVSAGTTVHTTAHSFTPNISVTDKYVVIAAVQHGSQNASAAGASVFQKITRNASDLVESVWEGTLASVAATRSMISPLLMAIETTVTSGTGNNWSVLMRAESSISTSQFERSCIAILQLSSGAAAVGGTTLSTLAATGQGFASIIKLVGKPVEALETNIAGLAKGRFATLSGISSALTQIARGFFISATAISSGQAGQSFGRFQLLQAVSTGTVAFTRMVGKMLQGVSSGVGSTVKSVGKTLAATGTGIAALAITWLLTLSAVGRGVAALNAVVIVIQFVTLSAVSTSIASMTKMVGKPLGTVGTAVGGMIRMVGKPLQAVGTGIAALNANIILTQLLTAIGRGIAALTTTVEAAAPEGPYVLSLGDSVKRFVSVLKHRTLGKGTVSDRDPA